MMDEAKEKTPCFNLRILERRKHFRFRWNLPIEYIHIQDNTSSIHPGYTLNASKSGLKVVISEKLKIGQHLAMTIFFSFGPEVRASELPAEVVWVGKLEKDGNYQTGLRFVDSDSKGFGS
jgi:hypothetical protein